MRQRWPGVPVTACSNSEMRSSLITWSVLLPTLADVVAIGLTNVYAVYKTKFPLKAKSKSAFPHRIRPPFNFDPDSLPSYPGMLKE